MNGCYGVTRAKLQERSGDGCLEAGLACMTEGGGESFPNDKGWSLLWKM